MAAWLLRKSSTSSLDVGPVHLVGQDIAGTTIFRLASTYRRLFTGYQEVWRRGPGSNRRIKVLQTSPLPLGYRALVVLRTP